MKNRRVVYLYDENIGNFCYSLGHMMKPKRIAVAHSLIEAYHLDEKMRIITPFRASLEDMARYHSREYLEFMSREVVENNHTSIETAKKFGFGGEQSLFPGVFEFSQISAGGSIHGSRLLNTGAADIAINWAGGLHHAKRAEASGFCYVADCVLGILTLLDHFSRVLYVDIDIHHGDGVEEAFYTTDRVMTVSFHKFGDFFPGTGNCADIGIGRGKHYSVNVPLRDGIDDICYVELFKSVIQKVMDWYRPQAVMMQCGADSLACDRLGWFNLSIKAHSECLQFVKSFGLPMIVVGGGGYTVRNAARCWAFETATLLGEKLDNSIPNNDFQEFFAPEYSLELTKSLIANQNTPEYINSVKEATFESLRHLPCAPSLQIFADSPKKLLEDSDDEDYFDKAQIDKYIGKSIAILK